MEKSCKVILVTGASSGLGLAISRHLFEKGHTVYAGARSFRRLAPQDAVETGAGRLSKVYLDVTDQDTVDETINTILSREGRLDVLINCAVHLVLGSVEDTSSEEFEGVVKSGLLGTFRMCRKAVPIMREQRNGLIINFSSVCGILAIPFSSAYSAAKFGIEGFSESLSMEVKEFNIKVVIVQPGDHRSGSSLYRPHAKNADSRESAYYDKYINSTSVIEQDESNGSHPEHLAALVEKIINTPRPRLRYKKVDQFDQNLAILLHKILPGRLFETILSDYYFKGLDK